MSIHVDNIVDDILQEVERKLDRFADDTGLAIHLFLHDLDSLLINYEILPNGETAEAIKRSFNKEIDELVNGKTRILYRREDKENYILDNGIVFRWNDIVVDEVFPAIEKGIQDNIIQNIEVEESYLEDYIVDYEENDPRGEDSYYVSEYDVSNELDHLKSSVYANTNFREFWDLDTLVDRWEDRQR